MTDQDHEYTNALINESSPYLLQHAHNPVNWYPWGEEALQKAQDEDKLIIVSIGYAACHWCHVMEHESFEDSTVAKIMNDHFVSIKIDREERPDIDQVYMNAVQLISGRGGWPLNALALPDGRPVYAGTYYPKAKWMEVLNHFIGLKNDEPETLETQATQITEGIQGIEMVEFNEDAYSFQRTDLNIAFANWLDKIDFIKGGRKGAPKFPMPNNYIHLLRYYHMSQNKEAKAALDVSLTKIAEGGIYDHILGGFARYATDANWLIPHFEKMMYDNGQLVSLYAEAYRMDPKPLYKKAVYETIEWVEKEMTSPDGGFYSSLDADSEGEEGKYYIWHKKEVMDILGEEGELFCDYYDITERGNWEHKNIPNIHNNSQKVKEESGLSAAEFDQQIEAQRRKLFAERDKRIHPGLDDKVLTSWNALMLKGYVDAYKTFGEKRFLDKALMNARFLEKNAIQSDFRLNRNYKNGKSSINAFLDDYALLIDAYVALYQVTFDEHWLQQAKGLTDYAIAHFYDDKSKMFFYTSNEDPALIARKMEVADNVIPASNSSMALALLQVGTYFYETDYLDKAKMMVNNVINDALPSGPWYSNWLTCLYYLTQEPYEVAIVGPDWEQELKQFNASFLPRVWPLGGASEGSLELLENKLQEGQTTIYVCQNRVCKFPVTKFKDALNLMD